MFSKLIKSLAFVLALASTAVSAQENMNHEGVVIDTMNGGNYTYVQVKEGDQTFWAAGPQVAVKKGDKVSMKGQMWMTDFTSKTLDRTFDKVLFVGSIDKK